MNNDCFLILFSRVITDNETISWSFPLPAVIFTSIFQLSCSGTTCCCRRQWPSRVLYCSAVA